MAGGSSSSAGAAGTGALRACGSAAECFSSSTELEIPAEMHAAESACASSWIAALMVSSGEAQGKVQLLQLRREHALAHHASTKVHEGNGRNFPPALPTNQTRRERE
eukprot:m.504566 g.504566  ORF g.504566 m.504566 type:complete len:107 (-) comp57355_c0_seq10:91-411(-)